MFRTWVKFIAVYHCQNPLYSANVFCRNAAVFFAVSGVLVMGQQK
jgi:hypothetical protein